MKRKIDISFIIPAKDEEKSVEILYGEIINIMSKIEKPFEIIFVDDGSQDKTFEKIKTLRKRDERVKIVKLRGNWGKSVALQTGFDCSSGNIIVTMDADLQDNPGDLPKLLQKIESGADLVSGWKKIRRDPISKVLPSRVFNGMVSILLRIKIHDVNCGFKVFRKEVLKDIRLYGELYRFIPIMVASQNYTIEEVIVKHRKRKFGKSKFGWKRTIKGFLDMLTVIFLIKYMQKPAHFFGTFGLISFFSGFIISLYITYLRVTTGSIQFRHPLLFLGILLIIIGIQLLTTGLVAELMLSFNQKEKSTKKHIEQSLL